MPANASAALEEAMQDALPDLFEASPDLMYQLVTMVSPLNLQVCAKHLARKGYQLSAVVHHTARITDVVKSTSALASLLSLQLAQS